MKIKHAPIGSTVKQNGNKAIVLSSGPMGTRINVISGDRDSVTFGKQIWSNESIVELAPDEQDHSKFNGLGKKGINVPQYFGIGYSEKG